MDAIDRKALVFADTKRPKIYNNEQIIAHSNLMIGYAQGYRDCLSSPAWKPIHELPDHKCMILLKSIEAEEGQLWNYQLAIYDGIEDCEDVHGGVFSVSNYDEFLLLEFIHEK